MFPIHLNNYFAPLNVATFAWLSFALLTFESLGFLFSQTLIKPPLWTRSTWWIFGLGLFSFVWFILNLFFPLNSKNVFYAFLFLLSVSLPWYIKNRGPHNFASHLLSLRVPLILFAPLYPLVFVKASLPPYLTDEMAYQFLSPSDLQASEVWKFSGGIYHVIPKTLNVVYHTTFALSHTYSLARSIHFLILFSSMLAVYCWLKNKLGRLVAILFWLILFFSPQLIFYESATSGYIDLATASLVVLGTLINIDFLNKEQTDLKSNAAFWGLALGIKYTAITAFIANLSTLVWAWVTRKEIRISTKNQTWRKIIAVFIVLGGFWYVKNLILTGNPVYPFIFGCKSVDCIGNQSFFSGWTIPVTIKNLPTIYNDLLFGNRKLQLFVAIASFLSLISLKSKTKRLVVLLGILVLIEMIVISRFSGYHMRYFWHLQFFAFLILAITIRPAFPPKEHFLIKGSKIVLLLLLAIFVVKNFYRTSRFSYAVDRLPKSQVDYALGRTNIHQWIEQQFPEMYTVINWCDEQNSTTPIKLYRSDPDLIWASYEGQMRAFMTNCLLRDVGLDKDLPVSTAADQLRAQLRPNDFYTSLNECQKPEEVTPLYYETLWQVYLRQANNNIVCNIDKVIPHLYQVGQ